MFDFLQPNNSRRKSPRQFPTPVSGANNVVAFFVIRNANKLLWGLKLLRKGNAKNRRRKKIGAMGPTTSAFDPLGVLVTRRATQFSVERDENSRLTHADLHLALDEMLFKGGSLNRKLMEAGHSSSDS